MVFWPVQGINPALSIILYFSILLGLLANWQEEEVENVEDCFVSNERYLKMINESNFYMIGMILTKKNTNGSSKDICTAFVDCGVLGNLCVLPDLLRC